MKRYRNFVQNRFIWLQLVITLVVCAVVLGYMLNDAKRPLSSSELAKHNANLQLIKEDFANITKVGKAEVKVANEQATVLFKGSDCTLKAIFDVEGNCVSSKIIDNRPGSSFGQSLMLTLMTFVLVFALTYVLKGICYLPMCLFSLSEKVAKFIRKGGVRT